MIKLTNQGLRKVKKYTRSIRKSLIKEQNQNLITDESFIKSIEVMEYSSKIHIKDVCTNKSITLISNIDFVEILYDVKIDI